MKKRTYITAFTVFILFFITLNSFNNKTVTTGAPSGHTGAPNELTCAKSGCHDGSLPNSGIGYLSLNFGKKEIAYEPGKTYNISIALNQEDIERFGFQFVAINNTDSLSVGTISLTDLNRTQTIQGSSQFAGKEYVTYTYLGTNPNDTAGLCYWSFNWIAPDQDEGPVTFYVAAVSANNDSTVDGDLTYTKSLEIQPKTVTSAQEPSEEFSFSVFPNPASEILYLNYFIDKKDDLKVELLDIQGKLIDVLLSETKTAGNHQSAFQLGGNYPKGIYILKLSIGARAWYRKVLIY